MRKFPSKPNFTKLCVGKFLAFEDLKNKKLIGLDRISAKLNLFYWEISLKFKFRF